MGCEAALARPEHQPKQQPHSDDHVQGVQPGHGEIEKEIELGMVEAARRQLCENFSLGCPVKAWDNMLYEFLVVFDAFYTQKHAAKNHRRYQEKNERAPVTRLRGAHRKRHRETAAQQDHCVQRAQADVQDVASAFKRGKVEPAKDRIRGKHAAKKHDFRHQEDPYSQRIGVLLLFEVLELMCQSGVLRLGVYVSHRCVLLLTRVCIGFFGHHGRLREILGRRRRRGFPLQPLRTPRVRLGDRTVAHRPDQVNQRNDVSHAQDRRSGRRHHVQHLELRGIERVPARHAEIPEDELREKREIEADENNRRCERRPAIRILSSGNFRPPEVDAAEIAHHRAAHHDVVKVGHDKVRAVQVHVCGQRGQEQAGQSAHGEQADEAQRVEHRSVVRDRAFIECRGPIEDLDGRRNRHQETQHRKDQSLVHGLSRDEHVMSPHEKAQHRDGYTGECDQLVTKNALPGETGDDFADHAHRRQDHDVNGGMRIEPEQMLEQQRVAAQCRTENSHVEKTLQRQQKQRDREHGRAQHHDDTGGVDGPQEQRQAEPGQPWRPHLVNRHDEVQTCENGRKTGNEHAHGNGRHLCIRIRAAVRGVERPPGIHATGKCRVKRERYHRRYRCTSSTGSASEMRDRGPQPSKEPGNSPARRGSTESGRRKS